MCVCVLRFICISPRLESSKHRNRFPFSCIVQSIENVKAFNECRHIPLNVSVFLCALVALYKTVYGYVGNYVYDRPLT